MGIPVLHGVAGESADIVEREGVGRVFEPENVQQLVQGLKDMRDDTAMRQSMKERGLQASLRYDRKNLGLEMLAVLEALGGSKGRPAPKAGKVM